MPGGYPYLASTVIGFIVVVAGYLITAQKRTFMLAGGLALVPFSLCSVLHENVYWSTRRLGGLSWGIEDLLFTFSVGSLVALVGALIFQGGLTDKVNWPLFFKRYLLISLLGAGIALLLTIPGVDIMLATIVTQAVLIAALLAAGRYSFGLSLAVALIYTVYYIVMMKIFFFLFPGFAAGWNGTHLWPFKIGALPLEEIVWVFTFAWSWILILLFSLNLKNKDQRSFS
jgi:hypothetical protein